MSNELLEKLVKALWVFVIGSLLGLGLVEIDRMHKSEYTETTIASGVQVFSDARSARLNCLEGRYADMTKPDETESTYACPIYVRVRIYLPPE